MNYSNYQPGMPPFQLQEGERLIVQEHRTLFGGRRVTYRVVRDSEGGCGLWTVLILIIIVAVAGYLVL